MEVITAVGFMNRRPEIPKDLDPLWASLMKGLSNKTTKCTVRSNSVTKFLFGKKRRVVKRKLKTYDVPEMFLERKGKKVIPNSSFSSSSQIEIIWREVEF